MLKTVQEFGSTEWYVPKHTDQNYFPVICFFNIPQDQDENVSSLLSLHMGDIYFNHSHLHSKNLNPAFG